MVSICGMSVVSVISYKANKTQKDLTQNKVKVFNLAEQSWIEKTHKITNGSFILTKDEMLTLVGITSLENEFYIKGYTLYNNKDEVFSYKIQGDYIPQNIICTKPGEFFYSVQEENETIFTFVNTQTDTTTINVLLSSEHTSLTLFVSS